MACFRLCLADTKAQGELSIQHRVSQVHFAGFIESIENPAVKLIAIAVAETH